VDDKAPKHECNRCGLVHGGHDDWPTDTSDEDLLNVIRLKCEQFWNEHGLNDAEVHATLEFIHTRVCKLLKRSATLREIVAELAETTVSNNRPDYMASVDCDLVQRARDAIGR
jgi:hypothetical protein